MKGCEKTMSHFLEIAHGPFQERRGGRVCNLSSLVENLDTTQTRIVQDKCKNSAVNLGETLKNK